MQEKNSLKKQLLIKIKSKTAILCVMGLGYVGLSLVAGKAKPGCKTVGFDV